MPAARECLSNFLSVSALCLEEDDQPGLNVTMAMVDSAIQFACHRDGDRIACKYYRKTFLLTLMEQENSISLGFIDFI